jgi:hypothetical protein
MENQDAPDPDPGQTGPHSAGDCSFDYVIALNHVSDVTGTFSSTGTGGAYQGSLTSQETVNNRMDATSYGDFPCPMGTFYFTEIATGTGSEENPQSNEIEFALPCLYSPYGLTPAVFCRM